MSSFRSIFQIVENKKCPLYELDDKLELTDKALLPPQDKPVCLILAREMTELLFALLSQDKDGHDPEKLFSCSGCSGLIKFRMNYNTIATEDEAATSLSEILGTEINVPHRLVDGLGTIGLFQVIEKKNLARILPCFTYKKFSPGSDIFRKGEEAGNVVIILSGKVAVLDGDQRIAVLGRGEVLGEMSQLTAQAVCATVRTIDPTEVLCIAGQEMKNLLNKNPSLYIYFLRLLSDRLTKSNAARLQEVAYAMSGSLAEMPQVELFQLFHMNGKTGVLTIELPDGEARISFREGCIINASYAGEKNQEAIYRIIAERKGGRFKFNAGLSPQEMKAAEIGEFMKLLMDGIRRIDEENSPEEEDEA
ncbi:MAG: DUF4388 domain-containing protein [Proteobacteria bacterium]|nr:DUF4388 domain-containing protein [Pseudomonadota bacterium]MBU4297037.1 DUF4388 domain-containing protein [Pseudomonadota bacterium]MCG2749918.1 DUF4388 domain-containing protein [Desulfobulbaceae bacterium]